MTEFRITRGTCYALFVFEVGHSIDLEACERQVGTGGERQTLRHRGRETQLLQLRPPPLRIAQDAAPVPVGSCQTEPSIDLTLYEFGAASVTYRLPLTGRLEDLLDLSLTLRGRHDLAAEARTRVEALIRSMGTAVVRPRVADLTEEYTIFAIEAGEPAGDAAAFCAANASRIAQVLRAERAALSQEEVHDATEARISFGLGDITVVDWDAALVLDSDPRDVRAVLEFANVQLLEMRYLDRQLDEAIERCYQLVARRPGLRNLGPGAFSADLDVAAELQLEGAVLLERVTNAVKFFGEEYLTRIYRLASRRFQLPELDASITNKLATIESIYQKMADRAAGRRMELLEWVVIILIALEIILSLSH